MFKKYFVFLIIFLGFILPFIASAGSPCDALGYDLGGLARRYDSSQNNRLEWSEMERAMKDYYEIYKIYDLSKEEFLDLIRFAYYDCSIPSIQKEDPISGTLSVDNTTVNVGENIRLTVTGQDDNGLTKLWAHYHNAWHSDSADGISFEKTWTFSESKSGTYVYKGYVYGTTASGLREASWTEPKSITVIVKSEQSCLDSDGGRDYYLKGKCIDGVEGTEQNPLWDYCYYGSGTGHVLAEMVCSNNGCVARDYQCPYGCENGACLEEVKKPDLTVTSAEFSNNDRKLYYTVLNKGKVIAGASQSFFTVDSERGGIDNIGSIAPGSSRVSHFDDLECDPGQSYRIGICADWDHKVSESNEDNNCYNVTLSCPGEEDTISSTLSVDKTSVNTGENITLTIKAQDDQGIDKVRAYYQGSWHYYSCNNQTTCTNVWTFSESTIGNKYYYGYAYGKKLDGSAENSNTIPRYVKVNVSSSATCNDSDGGHDYYTKGECTESIGSSSLVDYCFSDGETLSETVCYNDSCASYSYKCPYGCEGGVCLREEKNPDLTISSIISQPTSPTTNDKINFRATIKNSGSEKMSYVSGGIITKISSDSLPSPGWRICDAMTTSLASGQMVVIDCPIFQTLPTGSHKFTFSTDDENRLSESNENNNAKTFYLTVGSTVREDAVSGTLSVDKTTVKVGESIKLTVTGQDDNGLSNLWAYYHNTWHSDYADGTSYNKTWAFSEASPGTYVYRGYVYGKKTDGSVEYTWTNPSSVTVVVIAIATEETTCSDSDGGKNYYVKGSSTPSSSAIDGRVDCCKLSYSTYMGDSVNHIGPGGGACVTSGPYLYEAICGSDGNPTTVVYQCPNGCENGVCVSATTEAEKEGLSSMMASIQTAINSLMKQLQELKK